MKKLFVALFIAALLIPVFASANVDLSSMSYDELVILKDQINLAMWNSEKWQEVTVPDGLWVVGEDIPEGHWTIRCTDSGWNTVYYGSALESNGKHISENTSDYYASVVVGPNHRMNKDGSYRTQIDIDVKAGAYICISGASAIFTPYFGKPDLGFK